MLGSIAIAVNSLAGPAILQLPFQFQQSGIIPTIACLLFIGVLSSYVCLHTANTISYISHNTNFQKCVEFSDPYRYFINERMYNVTQILFFLTAISLNVAAIIDTAEVVDSVLGLHGTTWAVSMDDMELQSWSWHHACTRSDVKMGICDPFSDMSKYGEYILTLGYLITAAVFVPICLKDLKENTMWQIFGFGILVTLSLYFCYAFYNSGHVALHHTGGFWGHSYDNMLGVIMFNFALVLAIPAWVHEKKSNVSTVKAVVYSTTIATTLYIGVGLLAALSISHVNVNLLTPMVSGAYGYGVQIAASIFAFFIIGLDIPLFCVLTRYNLTHSGLCTERTANILVVYIPWGLAWLFYQGDAVGDLLSWSGTLLTSALAFILPLYVAIRALQQSPSDYFGSITIYTSRYMKENKSAQITALWILFWIATMTVIVAIGGKMLSMEETQAYIQSWDYVNATDMAIASTEENILHALSYPTNFVHRYLRS